MSRWSTASMKLPIPDDWDGESVRCNCIEYPDSDKWEAIVTGTLMHLVRGRSWDESTGIITDAQDIARSIAYSFVKQDPVTGEDRMTCLEEILEAIENIEGAPGGGGALEELCPGCEDALVWEIFQEVVGDCLPLLISGGL